MTFGVNTSPFSGKEGRFTTSRNIKERMERVVQNGVAIPRRSRYRFGKFHGFRSPANFTLRFSSRKMRRDGFELLAGGGLPPGSSSPRAAFLAPLDPLLGPRPAAPAVRVRLRLGGLCPRAQAPLGLLRAAPPLRRPGRQDGSNCASSARRPDGLDPRPVVGGRRRPAHDTRPGRRRARCLGRLTSRSPAPTDCAGARAYRVRDGYFGTPRPNRSQRRSA